MPLLLVIIYLSPIVRDLTLRFLDCLRRGRVGSLAQQGLPEARTVASMKDSANVRYAGLVICRQRPGTAGGVVFMTLEDETGLVNVIVWESVFQRYSVLARTVSFLGITGKLQVEDGVVHLVAEKLWQPRAELKPSGASSRDFH